VRPASRPATRRTALAVALGALGALTLAAPAPARASPARQGDAELGRAVYDERCAFCHGAEGDGEGPVAPTLLPRPRDFTGSVFKLRTTANATLPTDEDLVRTIRVGIPGTAMPAWEGVLSAAEIDAVVATLKSFDAEAWTDASIAPEVVAVGGAPTAGEAQIARGREIYAGEEAQCIRCHGEAGRGDGESAPGMTDEWDYPIFPADLTKSWRFKGGHTVEDIFTRFSTGMDGSPMPSYLAALPEAADRWALAAYVHSLGETLSDETVLEARRVAGALPAAPDDAAWDDVPALRLPLAGQVVFAPRWQTPSVDAVAVQAVYNDDLIAFRLTWHDRFHDTEGSSEPPPLPADTTTYVNPVSDYVVAHPAYADRIELQFPAAMKAGAPKPYFLYGTSAAPVALWRWAADEDAARELNQAGARAEAAAQADAGQELAATGAWEAGRYRVVLTRPRTPADAGDLAFPEGDPIPFAVHAWDGSMGETSWVDADGRASHLMSVSAWASLVLKPPTPPGVYGWALVAALLVGGAEWWVVRRLRAGRVPGGDS